MDEADWISAADMIRAPYRPPVTRPVRRIYDMGANIGSFALLAKSEFPNAELHCYEPSSENVRVLRLNLRLNRIKAEIHQVACWSHDGTIFFRPAASNLGLVAETPPGIEVRCVLPRVAEDSWVKMDIEGSEFKVLPSLLEQSPRPLALALEIHWQSPNRIDLPSVLKSQGYEPDLAADPNTICQEINYSPVAAVRA
jgi:FkbM family methyltransferase